MRARMRWVDPVVVILGRNAGHAGVKCYCSAAMGKVLKVGGLEYNPLIIPFALAL